MTSQRGMAIVEFTIVAALFLTLMFSVLELGRLSHVQLVMGAAAREGARRAAVDGGESARVLEGIGQQLAWGGVDPDQVSITVRPRQAAYGSTITVTLDYRYRFSSGPLVSLAPNGVELTSTIHIRSERLENR